MQDFQHLTDPRMNEAAWRALDLMRAYASRDRAAIIEHLANLEPDQLEYAAGVLITMYNDTREVLDDTERPCNPATVRREVDAVACLAPAEHEFAVAVTALRLANGEVKMQEVANTTEIRDRIHTMAVYSLALQLAVFSRKGVQRSLDEAARMNEAIGGPRPYSVA
ncbi:hypothetical protein [Embleya sp. NPDC001921]